MLIRLPLMTTIHSGYHELCLRLCVQGDAAQAVGRIVFRGHVKSLGLFVATKRFHARPVKPLGNLLRDAEMHFWFTHFRHHVLWIVSRPLRTPQRLAERLHCRNPARVPRGRVSHEPRGGLWVLLVVVVNQDLVPMGCNRISMVCTYILCEIRQDSSNQLSGCMYILHSGYSYP